MYHGERFNSISHLVGAALAIAAASVMISLAAFDGDPWKIVSVSIFGAVLILLYTFSTLYHSIRPVRAKAVLRRFDHSAIYLLIAGTYTPFTLVTLRGPLGWTIFGAVWAMAVYGIARSWLARLADDPAVWPYLVMGWFCVLAIVPLAARLGAGGMTWLALGGLLYSAGIVFFVHDSRWRHAHGIWHLFVLAGSAAHVVAVIGYVD